jgi:small-conductance mechanosensitive channel
MKTIQTAARALGLVCLLATAAAAQGRPAAPAATGAGPDTEITHATAPVVLDGATLFRVRGFSLYPAEERARIISDRIAEVARARTIPPDEVRAVPVEDVIDIVAGDHVLMVVTDADARFVGVDRRALAQATVERIQRGLRSFRQAREPAVLLDAAWRSLLATAILVGTIFFLRRAFRWLEARFVRGYAEKLTSVRYQSFEILRAHRVRAAARAAIRGLRVVTAAVLVYFWLQFVLGSFPATRPLGARLITLLIEPLSRISAGLVSLLPNLAFLFVLYLLTRGVLRFARLFFDAVAAGRVTFSGFEPEWALPTYRIVRMLVVAFALVAAYPYIPGSSSASFQSLSIFFGVVFSIGSSSFVANVIAGYSMTYRRAFRLGDWIQVGDVFGEVTEIRLQVTHLRSIRNEEVVLPNSSLLNSNVLNYSALAREEGLILHTTVGIGYETPWRQVEAMLLLAAERTEGLARKPAPFVLAKSLGDFCVVYEINVYCDAPAEMMQLYTRLHKSILDVFNEYGVQIMTPNYESDPAEPKLVPREQWWTEPARPPGTELPAAGEREEPRP